MSIEKLTDEESQWIVALLPRSGDKALRIIDQLTEALALESELVTLHAGGASRAEALVRELDHQLTTANALLARIGVWTDGYGSALVPHGGASDTFGDGVRRCKRQVKEILSAQPAPTDHDRAVLEAMANVPVQNLRALLHGGQCALKGLPEAASAELARREAKR